MRILLFITAVFLAAPFLEARLTSPETYAEHHPDGSLKSVRETIRDTDGNIVDHGTYRVFHPNGQLAEEGRFQRGVRVGPWTWYHEDGSLRGECVYEDGVGEYTAYYPSGAVLRRGRHRGVEREGIWTEWYESGHKRMQGPYVEDRQHGRWTYWEDGNPEPVLTIDWVHGERP